MMLDFKDWEKTGEDNKSVTMTHPKGHSMQILLKGIPLIQREALKRLPMADGGEIKNEKGVHNQSVMTENPGESTAGVAFRKGRTAIAEEHHQAKLKELKDMPNPKLKGLAKGGMAHYDEGTPNQPVSQDDTKPPVTVNVNQAPPSQSTAAEVATAPVNVPQTGVNQNNPSVLLPNGSMSAPGAAQTAQQATLEQEKINQAQAQAMTPVEQAKLQAQRDQAIQDQNNINALKTHADNLAANLKNIDPDAFVNNLSSPAKATAALGLFLGGFSTPFGGQNFTADYLNKQIDRDINAQISNNEKQKTIWGAYKDLYGDQNLASNMAKASIADLYATKTNQIALQLGTPQAIANAHKINADLAVVKNKAILDAAGNLSATQNNPQKGKSLPAQTGSGYNMITGQQESPQSNNGIMPASYETQVPGEGKSEDYASSPILGADANDKLIAARNDPRVRDQYSKVTDQFTQAQQADRVLDQLHEVQQNLYDAAKKGGASGYLKRHDPSAEVPIIGGALSKTFIQPFTDNPTNRQYASNRTRIVNDITNAVGPNVNSAEIERLVNDNLPEHGDSQEAVDQKERNIRIFIKNHVPRSLLNLTGISKD